MWKVVVNTVLITAFIGVVCGYNVDLESAVFHRGPRASMFGFSVATHMDKGDSWVLVGAPEASTEQPNVIRGGAVYRCSIDVPDECVQIPFDRSGNNNEGNQQIDTKSHQWFGATVRSSGVNGVVLACAPRYVWFSNSYRRREPVGTCFVARNSFGEYSEYSPCRTTSWGYHRQGSCQAGFGAALSPKGDRLFIGAVGSWYWQGQLYSIDITEPATRSPTFRSYITGSLLGPGQLFSQSLESRPDVIGTSEGPPTDDDSYLGYSVAVGEFNGDDQMDSAIGMPRGANLTGKIVLFSSNMTNIHNISGQQLGAYFGFSLAVVDVNGDGFDDIIIGAPLYTDYTNTEGKYETGRVYIVYQNSKHKFRRWTTLIGEVSRSRFGLSLTALGDINQDGYKDFAVGSPYDGPNGKGAVYIYHGAEDEIRKKPVQIIYAEDVNDQMTTFGYSLSGVLDLDNNQYPDLLVGAYESNNAVFFRSRPVIHLDANLTFESQSKQIDLDNKSNCSLLDGTAVVCTPLTLCVEYSGLGVDLKADIEVQYILDTKLPKSPRLFFLSEQGKNAVNKTHTLDKQSLFCSTQMVYVRPGVRDKLTPLEAEVRFFTKSASSSATVAGATSSRRRRRALTPILSQDPPPMRSDVIHIQKNCGPDNICIPNLRLAVKSNVESYIMGSGQKLEIEVFVTNAGEDSFETMLTLRLPRGVSYVNIDRTDSSKDAGILCSPPGADNVLRCDIGNPLPASRSANFKIVLQPLTGPSRAAAAAAEAVGEKPKSSLTFVIEANSTNPENEEDLEDNVRYLSVPMKVETELIVRGVSQPDIVYYNKSLYEQSPKTHESQIGPEVMHVYEIINKGPSDISQAEVYILWPSMNLAGDHLLYLIDAPEITGPAECSQIVVNPLKLQLDSKRSGATSGQASAFGGADSSGSSPGVSTQTRTSSSQQTVKQDGSARNSIQTSTKTESTNEIVKSSSGGQSKASKKGYDEYTTSKTTYIDSTGKKTVKVDTEDEDDSPITVIAPDETSIKKATGKSEEHGWDSVTQESSSGGSSGIKIITEERQGGSSSSRKTTTVEQGGAKSGQSSSTIVTEERQSTIGGGQSGGSRTSGSSVVTDERQSHIGEGQSGGYRTSGSSIVTEDRQSNIGGGQSGGSRTSGSSIVTEDRQSNIGGGQSGGSRTSGSSIVTEDRQSNIGGGQSGGSKTSGSSGGGSQSGRVQSAAQLAAARAREERLRQERFKNEQEAARLKERGEKLRLDEEKLRITVSQSTSEEERIRQEKLREEEELRLEEERIWLEEARQQYEDKLRLRQEQDKLRLKQHQQQLENEERLRQEEERIRQQRLEEERIRQRTSSQENRSQNSARRDQTLTEEERRNRWRTQHLPAVQEGSNVQGGSDEDGLRFTHYQTLQSGDVDADFSDLDTSSGWRTVHKSTQHNDLGNGTRTVTKTETKKRVTTTRKRIKDGVVVEETSSVWEDEPEAPGRRRRATDEELEEELKCGPTQCQKMVCKIGPLAKGADVLVRIRSRVWVQTLEQMGHKDVMISSKLVSRVTELPYGVDPTYLPIKSEKVTTKMESEDKLRDDASIPWWVIVLAAIAGVLLLSLLVFVLWKFGFFKRKRPTDAPEKQPLKNCKNGMHPGDEAL